MTTSGGSEPTPGPETVSLLLRQQAPHLAALPVRTIDTSGSSNWVFRVGDRLAARLPRSDDYTADLLTEIDYLPVVAPGLSVPVPEVVAVGEPTDHFPRPWAVVTWVPGEPPERLDGDRQMRLARSLGEFLGDLHAVDISAAAGRLGRWGYRAGEPVTDEIDGWADDAASDLADLFDPVAVGEAWRRIRDVPPSATPACWVHTDLSAENILVGSDGALSGVIDFGGLSVGDRSVDLLYAWSLLDAPARQVLGVAAGADEGMWARARAWAFVGPGLLTLAHYRNTMPARTARLVAMVETIATEVGVRLR